MSKMEARDLGVQADYCTLYLDGERLDSFIPKHIAAEIVERWQMVDEIKADEIKGVLQQGLKMNVMEVRKALSAFSDKSDFVIRVNGESYIIIGFIVSRDNKTVRPVLEKEEEQKPNEK